MLQALNILMSLRKYSQKDHKINFVFRHYCKRPDSNEYSKCFKMLGIPDGSDQECVRKAFIDLCKKYHPDSKQSSANALKFQEIESAYRVLQNKFAEERWNVNEGIGEYGLFYKEKNKGLNEKEEPVVLDIKHTAPQHRQYLSYDGFGSGTPSQREKQYNKYRRITAAENVYDHQLKKLSQGGLNSESDLIVRDKKEAKKIKTRYGMDRLVEDLIQESITKGHFDNLKGQGKPLPTSNYNPYVDFVTHKMNEILIENGFTPEWITLQKEIADEIQEIREKLIRERKKLGCLPLTLIEEKQWSRSVEGLKVNVQKLNRKINKYNLLVPMLQKQKLHFNLEQESYNILKFENFCSEAITEKKNKHIEKEMKEDLLSSLFSFLTRQ